MYSYDQSNKVKHKAKKLRNISSLMNVQDKKFRNRGTVCNLAQRLQISYPDNFPGISNKIIPAPFSPVDKPFHIKGSQVVMSP